MIHTKIESHLCPRQQFLPHGFVAFTSGTTGGPETSQFLNYILRHSQVFLGGTTLEVLSALLAAFVGLGVRLVPYIGLGVRLAPLIALGVKHRFFFRSWCTPCAVYCFIGLVLLLYFPGMDNWNYTLH